MCAAMYVVCMCLYECSYKYRQSTSGVIVQALSNVFSWVLSLGWHACSRIIWPAGEFQASSCLYFPGFEMQVCTTTSSLFTLLCIL